jgi:hypothetical protein
VFGQAFIEHLEFFGHLVTDPWSSVAEADSCSAQIGLTLSSACSFQDSLLDPENHPAQSRFTATSFSVTAIPSCTPCLPWYPHNAHWLKGGNADSEEEFEPAD